MWVWVCGCGCGCGCGFDCGFEWLVWLVWFLLWLYWWDGGVRVLVLCMGFRVVCLKGEGGVLEYYTNLGCYLQIYSLAQQISSANHENNYTHIP